MLAYIALAANRVAYVTTSLDLLLVDAPARNADTVIVLESEDEVALMTVCGIAESRRQNGRMTGRKFARDMQDVYTVSAVLRSLESLAPASEPAAPAGWESVEGGTVQDQRAIRMMHAATDLRAKLKAINELLIAYAVELDRNGTDSLAAVDYLNAITRDEMVIQQFTNAIADIEGEDL